VDMQEVAKAQLNLSKKINELTTNKEQFYNNVDIFQNWLKTLSSNEFKVLKGIIDGEIETRI